MPSRNILKIDIPESYYHVYNRGVSRQDIFLDEDDKATFLYLLKRYLSSEKTCSALGVPYPNYAGAIELLCFCLMDNHFHLLLYQETMGTMPKLMRSLLTSYSGYFNKKYNRSGPLFESRYKASLIDSESYLQHISRYIHLNPKSWRGYSFSSLPYYLGQYSADWVNPTKVLAIFENSDEYLDFVSDYKSYKDSLDAIKHQLANNIIQ